MAMQIRAFVAFSRRSSGRKTWLSAWMLAGLPLVTLTAQAAEENSVRAIEILRANCVQCHSKTMALSGLDLSSFDGAVKGGSRGPSLVPGRAGESRLMEAVERKGKLAMPPTKPLAAAEVDVLRAWINEGAKWPQGAETSATPRSTWWSFQPVKRPAVPDVQSEWASNEIDRFLLRRLNQEKLTPSTRASKQTLVRRAYLDLWGIPPTLAQVKEYVEDSSPDAWPKLINKLLASPHYGEKWGRHWLDLVRYSDTAGFELDSYIHDAWRYRDWVVQSFNEDKPYDRFVREQIAGDELFPEDPIAHSGTGLYCVGPNRDLFPDQADINRDEILTDYVDTTSAVFLGLTAGCARCHDHKFDPISQEDYYRIRAVFAPAVKTKVALNRLESLGYDIGESVREWKLREIGEQIRAIQGRCTESVRESRLSKLPAEAQEALRLSDPERTKKQRELATQYQQAARFTDDDVRACMNPQELSKLHDIEKSLVRMYANFRAKPFACGIIDSWNVAPRTFLPARGSRPEREVQPGFFSILGGGEVPPPAEKREATGPIPLMPTTGRRTALANWIANPDNPLTARVMVNRVWQYHFGRGLVATPSDFGTRGGAPTHPELLDWLTSEFIARKWSVKELHRLILMSSAYQQISTPSKDAVDRDPQNLLLSHFSRRRMGAEEIRDSILVATGELNPKQGGRPVVPPLTPEEQATLTQRPEDAWVLTADEREHKRRTLYLIQKRTFRMPIMEVFDQPESMLTCPRRDSSTTAPQSLSLLNGPFTMDRARSLAKKVRSDHATPDLQVQAVWESVLLRTPRDDERNRARKFLTDQAKNTGGEESALVELVRALLNVNEFLYVD
jgi:mono/diheme cytochrome c family protein